MSKLKTTLRKKVTPQQSVYFSYPLHPLFLVCDFKNLIMEDFDSGIAELLEVDSVHDTDVLADFDVWDSLTALSIIAFVDENYGVTVSAQDFVTAKTIGGLKTLVSAKTK